MKYIYNILLCLMASLFLHACVSGKFLESKNSQAYGITAYTDPAYQGAYFKSVAVYSDSNDFNWRRNIETYTAKQLQKYGAAAHLGSALLPPTRTWSQSEGDSLLRRAGVDALLVFDVDMDSTVQQVYVPYKQTTSKREESKTVNRDSDKDSTDKRPVKRSEKTVSQEVQTTEAKGGYMRTDVTRHYRINSRLIDLRNGAVAWVGSYSTSDDAYMREFANRVANQLMMDEIVYRRPID